MFFIFTLIGTRGHWCDLYYGATYSPEITYLQYLCVFAFHIHKDKKAGVTFIHDYSTNTSFFPLRILVTLPFRNGFTRLTSVVATQLSTQIAAIFQTASL